MFRTKFVPVHLHTYEILKLIFQVDNYGNKKPTHSYAELIRMAITQSETQRMTLSEIYEYVGNVEYRMHWKYCLMQ